MNPVNCNQRSNATIKLSPLGIERRYSGYTVLTVVMTGWVLLALAMFSLMNLNFTRYEVSPSVAVASGQLQRATPADEPPNRVDTPMGRGPFMPGPAVTTQTLTLELTPKATVKPDTNAKGGLYLPIVIAPYDVDESGIPPQMGTLGAEGAAVLTRTVHLTDTSTYTPTVLEPWEASVFGVETANLLAGGETIAAAGVSWVRRNGLVWYEVEPIQGMRSWRAAANLEKEMIQAGALNLKFVLIIRGTPEWAQQVQGSFCGPIKSDALRAFSWFVRDVVARYSAPPFNVQYFELGNEPDAPIRYGDEVYGCWGSSVDRYRGGSAYAAMLKAVYPQVKIANPEAKVLIGGLLANCDVEQPPAGEDCSWTRFFEGILENGGGPYFDGLSFHTYEYYYKTPGRWGNANWNSYYNTLGPVLIAKARYYKALLSSYNVRGKFLMDTEVALLCWDCTPAQQYETAKAWYLPEVYAASMAEGLQAAFWYSYNGWLGSGLVDGDGKPVPAMTALQVAREKFGGATFTGRVTPREVGIFDEELGIIGYKFRQGNRIIWLIRSADSQNREVVFNQFPTAITDPVGTELTPSRRLTLTLKPMYIEWKN